MNGEGPKQGKAALFTTGELADRDLKKMGVVLKRAKYFLTCSGRYYGEKRFEPEVIRNAILQMENGLQMSLFDDQWNRLEEGPRQEKLSAAGLL